MSQNIRKYRGNALLFLKTLLITMLSYEGVWILSSGEDHKLLSFLDVLEVKGSNLSPTRVKNLLLVRTCKNISRCAGNVLSQKQTSLSKIRLPE